MFGEEINTYISTYDCHVWRKTRLWNEECDIVFKYYLGLVQGIYDKYSVRYVKPG